MFSELYQKILNADSFDINSLKSLSQESNATIIAFLDELGKKTDFMKSYCVVEREVSDFNIGQYTEHLYVVNQNIAYFLWDNNFHREVIEFAVLKGNGEFLSNEGINVKKINSVEKLDTLLNIIDNNPDKYVYKNYTLFSLLFNLRDFVKDAGNLLNISEKATYYKKINGRIYSRYFNNKSNGNYNITVYNQKYHEEYCGYMPMPGGLNDSLINYLIRHSCINEVVNMIENNKIEWSSYNNSPYNPLLMLQDVKRKNENHYSLFDLITLSLSTIHDDMKKKFLNVADGNIWDILIKNKIYDINDLTWDYCKSIVETKEKTMQFRKIMTIVDYINERDCKLRPDFMTDFLFSYPVDVNESEWFNDLFSTIKSHLQLQKMEKKSACRF